MTALEAARKLKADREAEAKLQAKKEADEREYHQRQKESAQRIIEHVFGEFEGVNGIMDGGDGNKLMSDGVLIAEAEPGVKCYTSRDRYGDETDHYEYVINYKVLNRKTGKFSSTWDYAALNKFPELFGQSMADFV
jgi:membrane protein involved in colicin uptake